MFSNLALLDLSTADLLIILAIILLFFGGKRLPQLARSVGSVVRDVKKGVEEATEAVTFEQRPVAEEINVMDEPQKLPQGLGIERGKYIAAQTQRRSFL